MTNKSQLTLYFLALCFIVALQSCASSHKRMRVRGCGCGMEEHMGAR